MSAVGVVVAAVVVAVIVAVPFAGGGDASHSKLPELYAAYAAFNSAASSTHVLAVLISLPVNVHPNCVESTPPLRFDNTTFSDVARFLHDVMLPSVLSTPPPPLPPPPLPAVGWKGASSAESMQ